MKAQRVHYCHAPKCRNECPPKHLMCWDCWHKVPYRLKKEVLKHYRPGQERDKNPSGEYLRAAMNAIKYLW